MKLQTQFTIPKKEMGDLNYIKQRNTLEKKLKNCIDYQAEENFLVCLN